MVKVISFDVGGTLIDTEKGFMQHLKKKKKYKSFNFISPNTTIKKKRKYKLPLFLNGRAHYP